MPTKKNCFNKIFNVRTIKNITRARLKRKKKKAENEVNDKIANYKKMSTEKDEYKRK